MHDGFFLISDDAKVKKNQMHGLPLLSLIHCSEIKPLPLFFSIFPLIKIIHLKIEFSGCKLEATESKSVFGGFKLKFKQPKAKLQANRVNFEVYGRV